MKYKQAHGQPTQKVLWGTIASFVAALLFGYLSRRYGALLPEDTEAVLEEVLVALLIAGSTYAVAWFKRPSADDAIKPDPQATAATAHKAHDGQANLSFLYAVAALLFIILVIAILLGWVRL
jgi:hypothetical protein